MRVPHRALARPDVPARVALVDRDPRGARWAYLAGATGATANLLLVTFFASIPSAGRENPFGPANDIVGSVATACMIPAAIAIGRRLPPRGRLRALHGATLGSLAVATAAGPLLVAGVLPFPVATAASTGAWGVQVAWIGLGSAWLGRYSGLDRRTSRLGQACAWAALVGAGAAAGSLVAPGSLHDALLVGGVAVGATAFLAVPAWWALMGRWLDGHGSAGALSDATQRSEVKRG